MKIGRSEDLLKPRRPLGTVEVKAEKMRPAGTVRVISGRIAKPKRQGIGTIRLNAEVRS